MATIRCDCVKCGAGYYVKHEEVSLLPTMQAKRRTLPRPGDALLTWADWVWHLQTHCPECRISVPPPECVEDLDVHAAKAMRYRTTNDKLSEEP